MAPTYRTLVVLAQTKTTIFTNAQISSQTSYIITQSNTLSLAVDASRTACCGPKFLQVSSIQSLHSRSGRASSENSLLPFNDHIYVVDLICQSACVGKGLLLEAQSCGKYPV
jgi:hypothetical protein